MEEFKTALERWQSKFSEAEEVIWPLPLIATHIKFGCSAISLDSSGDESNGEGKGGVGDREG